MWFAVAALGGQGGQEEDEQKQRQSSEHAEAEDPQVQPRLRDGHRHLQGGQSSTFEDSYNNCY